MRADNQTGIRNLCTVATHILAHMPVNAATKFAVRSVLREAVNKSCPDYKGNDNKKNCRYISSLALQQPAGTTGALVADHVLPLSLLLKRIYENGTHDVDELIGLVSSYAVMALITREEDLRLRSAGLVKSMPPGWDGEDPLARYRHVGIALELHGR